jgi:GNAT superfamily N-acetyltransferase
MQVQLLIRQATEADLPSVLTLYAQPDIDAGDVLALDDAREIFARFQLYPDYKLYVVVDGADIVGSFALLIMDNLGHRGAPSGLVEDVVVAPNRQGQGIGKQMMAFAIERCHERGCYKLALSSNLKRERAHEFYESLGFERHGYSFRINF